MYLKELTDHICTNDQISISIEVYNDLWSTKINSHFSIQLLTQNVIM